MQISLIFEWLVSVADSIVYAVLVFILIIITVPGLLITSLFEDDELYEMEIQQLIEKGYLNADYTQEELGDLCLTSYNDFEEDYTNACFWKL
jgi:hypothetical protein